MATLGRRVGRIEIAAGHHGRAHGSEVIRAYSIPAHGRKLVRLRILSVHEGARVVAPAGADPVLHQGGGLHPGEPAHSFQQSLMKSNCFRIRSSALRRADPENQQSRGAHAQLHVLQIPESPDQQARSDEKYEA